MSTKHIFRPRTILYFTLWAAVGVGAGGRRCSCGPICSFTLRPERNPVFVTLSDGAIRNTYEIGVRNTHGEIAALLRVARRRQPVRRFRFKAPTQSVVEVPADTETKVRIYVVAPPGSDAGAAPTGPPIRIWVTDGESGDRASKDTVFNGTGQ